MNSQKSILLVDPQFDPTSSLNCNLLVKVGIDSFSYAIVDKETNKISAVFDEQQCENMTQKLSERLKNDTYLSLTFKEIKFACYTENNIAVPDLLDVKEDSEINTKFFSKPGSEKLYMNAYPSFGFTSVFSYSRMTDLIINDLLHASKKYHPNTALLKLAENLDETSLYLDFTGGAIYVLYIKEKRVIFQQCYEIEDKDELTYYLLLMINQLLINSNDTQVYVSGIIHQDDDKFQALTTYFQDINFLDFIEPSLNKELLDDLPMHYYTTLLALDKCV